MRILKDIHEESEPFDAQRPAISLRDVTFSYPGRNKSALKKINLNIAAGEFVVITGPSGCGKSTLAAALAGYIPHVVEGRLTGEIIVNGISSATADFSSLSTRTALCQQDPDAQLCTLSVREEAAFGPENLGLPVLEICHRVQESLAAVNAQQLIDRGTNALSGGEKQRVAIASMLAMHPNALILDEPAAHLDPGSAEEVLAAVEKLHREKKMTVIVIEHRIDRVLTLAGRMIVMDRGAIVMDGAPEEIACSYRAKLESDAARSKTPPAHDRQPESGNEESVSISNLRFSFHDREILHGISFQARKGELIGIIGPNGSGKSTFLGCLAGLHRPASGEIRVGGMDARRMRTAELARKIGFIFQNPNHQLFANTVWEELMFASHNFNKDRRTSEALARLIMEKHGIGCYESSHPLMLSHGEKRRLNICSALPHDPDIIILDEPFIGQDWANASIIMESISQLRQCGKTVLAVSHDMRWVYACCDRIAFFKDGNILANDVPSKVRRKIRELGAWNYLPEEERG